MFHIQFQENKKFFKNMTHIDHNNNNKKTYEQFFTFQPYLRQFFLFLFSFKSMVSYWITENHLNSRNQQNCFNFILFFLLPNWTDRVGRLTFVWAGRFLRVLTELSGDLWQVYFCFVLRFLTEVSKIGEKERDEESKQEDWEMKEAEIKWKNRVLVIE